MKTQPATGTPAAAQCLARLGDSHGYRFDGDTVFLNASFHASASADAGRSWHLRLIAGEAATGHVIAEAALPPLAELTGAVENFEIAAPATPPAARGFHALSLVLLSRDAAGTETLHDRAAYPLAQAFAQPRLCGPVGLWFESDTELVLDLDRVSNPRAAGNVSGTLSVEVWTSDRAYIDGVALGQPVAGAILGSLPAGDTWQPGTLHLNAAKPAAGSHLVVALREWNGTAYVTRDFVTFAPAPIAAQPPAQITAPAAPVIAPIPTAAVAPAIAATAKPAAVVAAAPVATPMTKIAAPAPVSEPAAALKPTPVAPAVTKPAAVTTAPKATTSAKITAPATAAAPAPTAAVKPTPAAAAPTAKTKSSQKSK